MAIKYHGGDRVTGLSTDAKPMFVPVNSVFYETDTNAFYDFDGSSWTERASGTDLTENLTIDGKTTTMTNWLTYNQTYPCSATSGVTATVDGKNTGAVSYTTPSDSLITATLLERKAGSGSWTTVTSNSASGQAFTDLIEDTAYQFRTTCTNFHGDSSVVTSNTIQTWIEPTTPTSCTATRDGDSEDIDIAFTGSNSGSSGLSITYAIERASDGGAFQATSQTAQAGTTWKDTTSVAGIAYTYRIRATNSAGNSAYSATSNAVTIPVNPVTGYGNSVKNPGGKLTGYNTYKYTTAGNSTFVVDQNATIRVLVVGAGGGGGGTQGKGGAGGGLVWTDSYTLGTGSYTVTVGANNGGSSSFDTNSATGGGNAGGSSGAGTLKSGVTGTASTSRSSGGNALYAGGGGAGSNQNGSSAGGYPGGSGGGRGGDGHSITGMEYVDQYYGGGGGGGAGWNAGGGAGSGGAGGGGNGAQDNSGCGSTGTAGTGGGGGANCSPGGGTGAVVILVTEG